MVYMNNLGDLLLKKYAQDFIHSMNQLGNVFSKPVKPKITHVKLAHGKDMKLQTLFKDNMFSRWTIQKVIKYPVDSYIVTKWPSVIGHRCSLLHRHYMTLGPNDQEFCYHCKKEIPTDILGLWKLQNYDLYTTEEANRQYQSATLI